MKLLDAINGGKGELDSELELLSEDELRAELRKLMSPEKTLRDEFAGQALQGELAAQCPERGEWTDATYRHLAHACYQIADAMLIERNKSCAQ